MADIMTIIIILQLGDIFHPHVVVPSHVLAIAITNNTTTVGTPLPTTTIITKLLLLLCE